MRSPAAIRSTPTRPRRSGRSEEHTSELQSPVQLVCRLLLEKKQKIRFRHIAGVMNFLHFSVGEIRSIIYVRYRCNYGHVDFLFETRLPTSPTLFPYTTLFRSDDPLARRPAAPLEPAGRCDRRRRSDRRLPDLADPGDRKSTRLNSSHPSSSYADFCSKKNRKFGSGISLGL